MTTWVNGTIDSSSWTNQTVDLGNSFLLLEDGSSYLLLEDGGKIILEPLPADAGWVNQSES